MKTLLYSLCLAAGLAAAATAITAPGSQARSVTAVLDTHVNVDRAARADRLPIGAPTPIVVKAFPVRPVRAGRDHKPPNGPIGCEVVVSPLADLVASRQPRQCL